MDAFALACISILSLLAICYGHYTDSQDLKKLDDLLEKFKSKNK